MKADTVMLTRVFGKDARYLVPLFQRPYVWKQEENWLPFWQDVRQTMERSEAAAANGETASPHFLGAIVLDQMSSGTGSLERRQVIDGQQRLTTLQVFIHAARQVALEHDQERVARLLLKLIHNDPDLSPRDDAGLLKVWPTNADRAQFKAVMSGQPTTGLIADAWRYFHDAILEWVGEVEDPAVRLAVLEQVVRTDLRLVAIDLEDHDDAQVIFETLNGRGSPLDAADLAKNLLFRKAEAAGADTQKLYDAYWAPFDTDEWRIERTTGRLTRSRLDVFLTHWLTMRTQQEISSATLFTGFDRWLRGTQPDPSQVFAELARYGSVYDSFETIDQHSADGRIFYRFDALQMTTAYPLALFLYGLDAATLASDARLRAMQAVDSYLVRRAICNLPTKDYNNIFRDVLSAVVRTPHAADQVVIATLGAQSGINRRWPDDDEFHAALTETSLYDRLVRARIRILLEGIEDHLRDTGYTEHLVVPTASQTSSKLTIEHVMPQSWEEHWPLADTSAQAADRRDALVHYLGNLTLATVKLNPALGNTGWATKKSWLTKHSLLLITTTTILTSPPGIAAVDWPDGWNEDCIEARGEYLAQQAIAAWPHQ